MKVNFRRKDDRYTAKKRGAMRQNKVLNSLWWCGEIIPMRKTSFKSLGSTCKWGFQDSLPILMTEEQWDKLKDRIMIEYKNNGLEYSNCYPDCEKVMVTPKDHYNPVMEINPLTKPRY